jgi:hypothetical protein
VTNLRLHPAEADRVLGRLCHGNGTADDLALDCEVFSDYTQQNLFCILAACADCGTAPSFRVVCMLAGRFVLDGIFVSDGLVPDGEPLGRDEGLDVLTEWARVWPLGRAA